VSASKSSTDTIAVIGAGITTAYNLAKRGCRVTIFGRHPYTAMETSFANGHLGTVGIFVCCRS